MNSIATISKVPELPPAAFPYQGHLNTLGIIMVFYSFQRLISMLLKGAEYKAMIETQSGLIRAQTEILKTQTEILKALSVSVAKLTEKVDEL